jgi:predicted lysophospholipase L1 biosynthesis ABC-type transport system permease subunit
MSFNVGTTDRIVRIALAVLLALAIVLGWVSGVVAIIAGVLAAVFLVTGVVKFCPLYFPFGIKTNKSDT